MRKNKPIRQLLCQFPGIGLLTVLLLICFCGASYARAGDTDEILNKKISLVAEQKEVKSILSEISKLAEIKFVYSPQRIPARRKVSLLAHDQRLGEILNLLLQPLDVLYYVSGNQIVLMKKGEEKNILVKLKDQSDINTVSEKESFYKDITGKVTNDKGEPLVGVSVLIKGTARGTTTNSSGSFTINAEVGETLDFSMVGYKLYSLKVGQENTVTIQLESEVFNIDEVVVVGYGTQKRKSVTGAVSSVSSKTLSELPALSISQALQGRVAGLQVTNNGSPGAEPIVRIRGISSISFASDPLYIVDGFPTGDLATIDVKDIESVDVLKDASAAAIYGSRATNGVIMITTKKGRRDGKVHVSLDSYVGTQEVTERLDLLDTEGFKQYALAYRGSQVDRLPPPTHRSAYPHGCNANLWSNEYRLAGRLF